MKKIPMRIFIAVLVAGIVGILGEIILKYDIDKLSENYVVIVEEYAANESYMSTLNTLLYKHQALIIKYVVEKNPIVNEYYKKEEVVLRQKIMDTLYEFDERMQDDMSKQLFHKVYSNAAGYFSNADHAMEFHDNGSQEMAIQYSTSLMNEFVLKMNTNLSDLSEYTVSEMNHAKEQMDYYIRLSQVSEIVCIIAIVAASVFALFYCYRLAKNLDNYRTKLEEEISARNRELLENKEKTISIQNNTIIGMANLIENRDGDTGEHIKRTSKYVELLAKEARKHNYHSEILTDHYIDLLIKAAPMHDIGKIAVKDSILKKPGKLTGEEFAEIQSHAAEGARIIRDVLGNIEEKEYVEIAASVAAGHHEKWDGSGYPLGQKGEEIPLCARIMAIADVYDALISKRCYKNAMSPDEAIAIIKESAGSHFDPTLAQIFIEQKEEIKKI